MGFCHTSWSLGSNQENPKARFFYVVLQQMLFGVTKSVEKKVVAILIAHLEP